MVPTLAAMVMTQLKVWQSTNANSLLCTDLVYWYPSEGLLTLTRSARGKGSVQSYL